MSKKKQKKKKESGEIDGSSEVGSYVLLSRDTVGCVFGELKRCYIFVFKT